MSEKELVQEIIIMRGRRGWTQQELADRIGTTQRTVAAWESGNSIPRKAMRVRIAQAFELPDEYFLGDLLTDTKSTAAKSAAKEQQDTAQLLEKFSSMLDSEGLSDEKKTMLLDSFSEILQK